MTKTKSSRNRPLGRASLVTRGPAPFGLVETIGYRPLTGISDD